MAPLLDLSVSLLATRTRQEKRRPEMEQENRKAHGIPPRGQFIFVSAAALLLLREFSQALQQRGALLVVIE